MRLVDGYVRGVLRTIKPKSRLFYGVYETTYYERKKKFLRELKHKDRLEYKRCFLAKYPRQVKERLAK